MIKNKTAVCPVIFYIQFGNVRIPVFIKKLFFIRNQKKTRPILDLPSDSIKN